MTSDHLGMIKGDPDLLPPGHGFGLGFAVRTHGGNGAIPRIGRQLLLGWSSRNNVLG